MGIKEDIEGLVFKVNPGPRPPAASAIPHNLLTESKAMMAGLKLKSQVDELIREMRALSLQYGDLAAENAKLMETIKDLRDKLSLANRKLEDLARPSADAEALKSRLIRYIENGCELDDY